MKICFEENKLSQENWASCTFENGLRVVFERSASEVVYCGYVIKAGTRNEEPADSGMAHFIEHMSFKGTERRRSFHINNGLERVGGDLNAFTNKQETVYYATVLKQDYPRAVDILTDLVFHSVYPQGEIDKEVEVIAEEIESYLDSPAELIFDDFEAMVFNGSALGRDILGRAERLREYKTEDARRFVDRWYRPENAVFYVYGNLEWKKVIREIEKCLKTSVSRPEMPVKDSSLLTAEPSAPSVKIIEKGTHQAHVVVGAPTFGGNDPRRFALALLNNIMGGPGMNSRLNMALREHAGLVYSIDSYLTTYVDTGWWCVYFGCDLEDIDRCLRMVKRELLRMIERPMTETQLTAAKKQMIGQFSIADNNSESYAHALGKCFAQYGSHRSTSEIVKHIQQVTIEEIQNLAAEIYAEDKLHTLIYR